MTPLTIIQYLSPVKRVLYKESPSRKATRRLPKAAWRVRPKPAWLSGGKPHWYRYPSGTLWSAKKRMIKQSGNMFEEEVS
jgi:hypothetical protein